MRKGQDEETFTNILFSKRQRKVGGRGFVPAADLALHGPDRGSP